MPVFIQKCELACNLAVDMLCNIYDWLDIKNMQVVFFVIALDGLLFIEN